MPYHFRMIFRSLLKCLRSVYNWLNPDWYRRLLILSVIAHIVFIFVYSTHPGVDGVIYQDVARRINASDSFWACGALAYAYWPPLFCIYLAAFYRIVGDHHTIFFLLNILTVLGTTVISRRYLAEIFGDLTARWAALLSFNSMIVYYFTLYYKYELLTGLLLSISLLFLLKKPSARRMLKLFLSGIFWGLAALATARVVALLPGYFFYIVATAQPSRHKAARSIAVLLAGAILAIVPWTIRNYVCFSDFIPITTNGGMNFYTGFNENANGSYIHPENLPPPYNTWDRVDQKSLYEAGFRYIAAHPGRAIILMLEKVNLMWRIHYADSSLFYPFVYLGLFIAPFLVAPDRKAGARAVQVMLLAYTAFHMCFIARYYYVVPLLPVIYGLAVACQRYLGDRLLRRLDPGSA